MLVRIPHRSLGAYKKVGIVVMDALEQQFGPDRPVIVVANRTIISSKGKYNFTNIVSAKSHPSQMRPRSRTLVTVHKEILNDVVSSLNHISCLWNGVMSNFWSSTTRCLGERVELFNFGQLTLFLLIIIAHALITFL